MSYFPNATIYTEPGATRFDITAVGWIVDPATNLNGTNVTSVFLYDTASGLSTVYYGNNTATPTANDPILVSPAGSTAGPLQNIYVPPGFGLYLGDTAGSTRAVGAYTAL